MRFLLLITFCLASIAAAAQNTQDTTQVKTVELRYADGYKWTALRIGNAAGYGVFRDIGTAPIRFKGMLLQPVLGLEFNGMRKWITTIDAYFSAGIFEDAVAPAFNFGSFDISNTLRFKMRRHFADLWSLSDNTDGLHWGRDKQKKYDDKINYAAFSFGIGAANFLDVTVNSEYENSSAGVSDFLGPEVSLRADFDFQSIFGTFAHDKFDKYFHTEIGLMPVAAVVRPGYAYISNYTASQPVYSSYFNEFEWHLKPFAGLWTDIGLDIVNGYSSRISISYQWSYFSSGESGAWRFDHATHLLLIDFAITLKNKSAR